MKAAMFSMTSVSSKRIIEAMSRHFDSVDHIDVREVELRIGRGKPVLLHNGQPLKEDYDCVFIRSSFRYALIQYALATFYEGKTYLPIKPDAYNIVNDKMLTHIALEKAGISTPETYISPTVESAKIMLNDLNFPIILKIPGGTHGKGVMFAESVASASGILDTLEGLKQAVLIQEYVETGGTDIRAIVVGDEVVGAMVRRATKDEKRANIHQGGSAEAIHLDANSRRTAIRTAKALGAEICAVDILESVKGPLVLEANLSPGLQGIMAATNRDIAEDMARYLIKKTQEYKNQISKTKASAQTIVDSIQPSSDKMQQIYAKLDFRGSRILLSELVSKMTGFKEEEVLIRLKNGKLEIERA